MNRFMTRAIVLAVAVAMVLTAALPCAALAQSLPAKPEPPRLMNDLGNMMSAQGAEVIENTLVDLWRRTGIQMAVVTVANMGGRTIEDYAVRLFEAWGIGEAGKDNGLLLLIAAKEREVRFETGYGLEGDLPDAFLGRVIDDAFVPAMRRGDVTGAIADAINMVQLRLEGYEGQGPGESQEKESPIPAILALLVFLTIVVLVSRAANKSGRGGPRPPSSGGGSGRSISGPVFIPPTFWGGGNKWGGGKGGSSGGGFGGFGGFGGGRSGGGGAGGKW